MEALIGIAVLGFIVSVALGLIALVNPKWFGLPRRLIAFVIFLELPSFVLLLF